MTLHFPVKDISKWKIDTCHADSRYPLKFGRYHSGWDINAKTGGDTDLGLPFYAVADGEVVFVSDDAGGAWGGLIVVWHPGLNIWSRYGHHKPGSAKVKVGDQVIGGVTQLASIGKGYRGTYLAHLHLDLILKKPGLSRSGRVWWSFWPNNEIGEFNLYYLNPTKLFTKFGVATPPVPDAFCRKEALAA